MKKTIGITALIILLVLAWAPWMGKTYFNKEAARSCGSAPATRDDGDGNPFSAPGFVNNGYIARYWVPFGRWEVHCRMSWYSLFTHNIMWYVHE